MKMKNAPQARGAATCAVRTHEAANGAPVCAANESARHAELLEMRAKAVRYASSWSRSSADAEDVAQGVVREMLQSNRRGAGTDDVAPVQQNMEEAWLIKAVRNDINDGWRRKRTHEKYLPLLTARVEHQFMSFTPEEEYAANQLGALVRETLSRHNIMPGMEDVALASLVEEGTRREARLRACFAPGKAPPTANALTVWVSRLRKKLALALAREGLVYHPRKAACGKAFRRSSPPRANRLDAV